ncbi:MAG TPA: ubiquinol-cytochrome c reductase iron-sulfur subunit [Anaerolineae bacterium]|nr:ubiquinol-cytochrome c reductase iron-sulfur subunit [Anaerolineae bacterium]
MAKDNATLPRRGFLRLINQALIATGLAAILGPIVAFFWPAKLEEMPSEPVAVGPVGSIAVGESKTIRFGRYPALVINTPDNGLLAYSAVCTHFACLVKWNPESGMIECPCHEGYFHPSDGSVISGPPPEPLESIPVFIEDDTLFIGGEA